MKGRKGIALALVLGATIALLGCSSYASSGSSNYSPDRPSLSCDEVLASVIQRERVGDTAGAINGEMQFLSDNCPSQYDAVTGFISAKIGIASSGFEPCDLWPARVGDEATALIRAEGLCEGGGSSASDGGSGVSGQPGGGIPWNDAAAYVGTTQRVCGPLASLRSWNDDVFLNIGVDYPDASRFVIVIWDVGRVEWVAPGTTVCTTGQIVTYEGVVQIEQRDPGTVLIEE